MLPNERIGRYELVAHLAAGGMGQVYLARAGGLGGFERHVVIKTLDMEGTDEDEATAMFLDEARLLGLLHHQHIAPVFEVSRHEERLYLVMDYVHGHPAHEVWTRTLSIGAALPIDFTLTVVSAAASGLHYAHTRRGPDGRRLHIVHRDVTLSNLMVGFDGAVKLIDFGIAKATNRSTQTQAGFIKGKVGYMAPEQLRGHAVDARTDVFALGIVLYELSTMRRAFREDSDRATMERIKNGQLVLPSAVIPDYPRELERIVVRALRVDPRERYPDADSMRRELEAFGHTIGLVLGDAAVVEVMTQLFENRREPWQQRAQTRAETELDVSLEIVPAGAGDDDETRQTKAARGPLRAATQAADELAAEMRATPVRGTNGAALRESRNGFETDGVTIVPSGRSDTAADPASSSDFAIPVSRDTIPLLEPTIRDDTGVVAEGSDTDAVAAMPASDSSTDVVAMPAAGKRGDGVTATPAAVGNDTDGVTILPAPARNDTDGVTILPAAVPNDTDGVTILPAPARTDPDGAVAGSGPPLGFFGEAPPIRPVPSQRMRAQPAQPAYPTERIKPRDRAKPPKPVRPIGPQGRVASSSRLGWGFAAFVTSAAIAGSVLGMQERSEPEAAQPTEPARVVMTASIDAGTVLSPALLDDAAPVPEIAPPPPAQAQTTVMVRIVTTPADATVLLDGKRLGKTPFEGTLDAAPGMHVLKLRRRGYNTAKLDLELLEDVSREVVLVRAKAEPPD